MKNNYYKKKKKLKKQDPTLEIWQKTAHKSHTSSKNPHNKIRCTNKLILLRH